MKYMLMIYGNEELWSSFPQEDFEQVVVETNALQAELKASGEFVGAYGVGDQVLAKTVTLVDGAPSKNPRYLQQRPDRTDARATAVAELSERLVRRMPAGAPLPRPVDVVAAGRRNNPPEGTVPALCSYGPLHYMEVPELFMEFISSMTGKSPSTTGFGSEGALTKGPFNALWPVVDMNNALVSAITRSKSSGANELHSSSLP